MKTKTLITSFILAVLFTLGAQGKDIVNTNKHGVAVKGYDVVAFQTEKKAVKGKKAHSSQYQSATYYFASAEGKSLFDANPAKYVPAYGGYCAWGLAEKNKLYPVSIKTWQVVDGRLFLNYNGGVKKKFNKNLSNYITQADANWTTHTK